MDPALTVGLVLIAHRSFSGALQDMGEKQGISNREAVGSPSRGAPNNVAALVILLNVVTGGLGGLYLSTQSIAVTALAAGLMALLGLYVVLSSRHRR